MRWLIGLTVALLLGTIAATAVGALLEDDVAAPSLSTGPTAPPSGATPGSGTTDGAPSTDHTPTSAGGSTTVGPTPAATADGPVAPTFTASEVALHATSASCWLIVSGQVYDVTTYLSDHPGGAPTITPWCGRESTEAFTTEDGEGEHSAKAWTLLDGYRVGALAG